ncbi:MAG: hypothetical protein QXL67_00320 [Candidatus Bathyarchaeia archaeon]
MARINKSKTLILLSLVAVVAIVSSIVLTAYAADNGRESGNCFGGWVKRNMEMGRCGWRHGWGLYRFVEVSEEYETKVISIAESDQDVQRLLNDGYNITGVRPLIKANIIDAEGNVVIKATSAIVMLEKDKMDRASVLVDVEEGKVAQIVILTRRVIEKT